MHQPWEYRALYAWMHMQEFLARDIDADPGDPSFHKPLTAWLSDLGAEGFEVVGVTPLVGMSVLVGTSVEVGGEPGLGVAVGVGVGLSVAVAVAVGVGVSLRIAVAVDVGVPLGVGVGDEPCGAQANAHAIVTTATGRRMFGPTR